MEQGHEERRVSYRRLEDLALKYSELRITIEAIKSEQIGTKSLIQSHTLRLQDGQHGLENKIDNLKEIMEEKLEDMKHKDESNEKEIDELKQMSNRIKGSLATLNWIGIGTFGFAILAFLKLFFGK